MLSASQKDQFNCQGFLILRSVFARQEISQLITHPEVVDGVAKPGTRSLLELPEFRKLATCERLRQIVETILGPQAACVRALWFNKQAAVNWQVGWHQDRVIAVQRREDVLGYSGWSIKHGVPHVNAPADVLSKLVALRIHFDDSLPENGPLKVIPGSHTFGVLSDAKTQSLIAQTSPVTCCASAGSVLAMRPLLLHASRKSACDLPRRVLHLEYAAEPLPLPLKWHDYLSKSN